MWSFIYRTAALADTLFNRTFPLWVAGIRPREEGKRWWKVNGMGIDWEAKINLADSHSDHLEMSGFEVSAIVSYGINSRGKLRLYRHIVWPRLRTWPNNTHASFSYNFAGLVGPKIFIDGHRLHLDRPGSFHFNGVLSIKGKEGAVEWERKLFPDPELPAFIERMVIKNTSVEPLQIHIANSETTRIINSKKGPGTSFTVCRKCVCPSQSMLEPGGTIQFEQEFTARESASPEPSPPHPDPHERRQQLIDTVSRSLILETGDAVLDTAFHLAKIRASESIYKTKGGLMHSPGGAAYYAALWTNDQCEYINPYFAWSGYEPGLEQAMNCYRRFAALMDKTGVNALPTSIIAGGEGIWNGAGDRGDAAMYAQGAGRFLLAAGRADWMHELLPAIDWCLDWSQRHRLNGAGPVGSDSDELEGRFPSGNANLCTSVLHFDALKSRSMLAQTLGDFKGAKLFDQEAQAMRKEINDHFGWNVKGFETYRYFEGCSVLRSWICLPLTVGINERAAATIAALFSPRLWTPNGLRTTSNDETIWDRSTLFALRGAFSAGATDQAYQKLKEYSERRLLGAHVPYPSEAYPEGNRRHLSAESGLYCRILIEGLFGLRPTGLKSFDWTPRLPASLPSIALRSIAAFDARDQNSGEGLLDLQIERLDKDHLQVRAYLVDRSQTRTKVQPFFDQILSDGSTVKVLVPDK